MLTATPWSHNRTFFFFFFSYKVFETREAFHTSARLSSDRPRSECPAATTRDGADSGSISRGPVMLVPTQCRLVPRFTRGS